MNKIGWCSETWNPVWGCNNHCEYCYARKIAKRFAGRMAMAEYDPHSYSTPSDDKTDRAVEGLSNDLKKFIPTFLYRQYHKKLPESLQRIFVGSMSEINHWEEKWMSMVLDRIKLYPQHTFQFLTKFPDIYLRYEFPNNCWLGITVTKDIDLNGVTFLQNAYRHSNNIEFISFEPLLNKIVFLSILNYFDWVIIGAETGNRKGKIIPKKEWVEDIVGYCRYKNIPVYLKDSLKNIYPVEIKEFPEVRRLK